MKSALEGWSRICLGLTAALVVVPAGVAQADKTDKTNVDRFGVREIYPTAPGGREWTLPDAADKLDWQWHPEFDDVTQVSPGVFHTRGKKGEIRLNIRSPEGAAWWQNVEMTGYFRETNTEAGSNQKPHWELLARGERHNNRPTTASDVNGGHAAPKGTVTWPGYPFPSDSPIPAECLGSSYHGNVYTDGRVHFEKEISHIEGYGTERRSESRVKGFQDPQNRWFGYKFIVYNRKAGGVHLELWLDANADGNWALVGQTDDIGGWSARDSHMNGCTQPPFGYTTDQIISWAGPFVIFRADSVAIDLKWLSVREIKPPG
jgi:hypothetical protein